MERKSLVDSFGRIHNYLRISVTDRCNLRCVYCMGSEGVNWLDREKILRYEEIVEVVKVAAGLGINKIRITGGEPLVRKDLSFLIKELRRIPGIKDLSLTTNGLLLAEQAKELHEAGLDRVNVSLDSLDPENYRQITRGGELKEVISGIEAALKVGLSPVKINVVLMKGLNDHEVPTFLKIASEQPLQIRFIEYMPLGTVNNEKLKDASLSAATVLETAAALETPLTENSSKNCGEGPSELFKLLGGIGSVGLIHPVSSLFCATCNRLRLTADGFLKPCLYWNDELAIRPCLGDNEALSRLFFRAMKIKKEKHDMSAGVQMNRIRCMSRIGG